MRIFANPHNLGFADNFLTAAERCTGDWIAFCDQDDYWQPTKLARIAEEIDARADPDLVMVCHVATVVDQDLIPTGRLLPDIAQTHVANENTQPGFWCMGGCVMAVRSDLVRDIDFRQRPPDDWPGAHADVGPLTQMPHDKWMSLLSNALGRSLFLAENLACYRRHGSTVTGPKVKVSGPARLLAARSTGSGYYQFRGETALTTATALNLLADNLDDRRAAKLRESAKRFKALSESLVDRAQLYQQGRMTGRLRILSQLVRRGAYFGDKVASLGLAALCKDIAFCVSPRAMLRS